MMIKMPPVLFGKPLAVRELDRKQSKLLVIIYFVSITQIVKQHQKKTKTPKPKKAPIVRILFISLTRRVMGACC